jgi:hypothetical protein
MPIPPDMQRALTSDASRQAVLTELHHRIVGCRDPRAMADLLGRYATAAIARQAGLGDDKQMWQLKLQNAMQKQAQAYQVLSNIMKVFNDTAKSIINNMK